MTVSSLALSRLRQRVQAGDGLFVEAGTGATSGCAAPFLAEAAACLGEQARIIAVVAPAGGLSLSSLIAQLSGRSDFDDHDDAVLALGYRRLAEPDEAGRRTLLLLDATSGLQRSALRYLQHVRRQLPDLAIAVVGGAELAAAFADPGLAGLSAHLAVADPVRFDIPAPLDPADDLLDAPAPAAEPTSSARISVLSESAPAGRRWLWAASAMGVAASLAIGAWVGHTLTMQNEAQPAETAVLPTVAKSLPPRASAMLPAAPTEAASSSIPPPERPTTPERAAVPHPPGATRPSASLARASAPTPVATNKDVALAPPSFPIATAESSKLDLPPTPPSPTPPPPLSVPSRTAPETAARARPVRRAETRTPRPGEYAAERRSYWPPSPLREPDDARDDWAERAPPSDYANPSEWDPPPRLAQRSGGPFVGTYAPGPYGTRVFRYEP